MKVNRKKSDTWQIQLKIVNSFISSIVNEEELVMHSKSDKIEIMINNEADEIIGELNRYQYQNNLESMKGSNSVFDYVFLLSCKCIKINPNHGGSKIDSPYWIKNKKGNNKYYQ